MARLTGGQALVKSLVGNGVETLFALPGVQLDHMFNALHDEGNAIRVINTRHEQGAAYMALGYSMASGDVGAYAVVPGPGLLNTTAALATAYGMHARVLCVTGQIPSAFIGRGYGMLHEIPDQLGVLRGLTKWADRIEHPAAAPALVENAFRQLLNGAPGPVGLEMAMDLMADSAEVALRGAVTAEPPPALDPETIDKAAALLAGSAAPAIFVGSGVFGAEAELKRLAELLQAPVVSNRTGHGALSARHPLALTQLAGQRVWAKADVVLAVGTRLQVQRMTWGTDDELKIIHVTLDPVELKRYGTPAVAIHGESRATLTALLAALETSLGKRASRQDEIAALKAEAWKTLEETLAPQMQWLGVLREALDDDGIFVEELTQVGYVARMGFPVYEPRTYLASGYQGTLGFGFATALGAKVARPDRQVLSISGDGGFMYNVQELSTAVQHNIPLLAVVFSDGAFGNVQRMQRDLHGGRVIATDLANPDFVKLAESFGAAGYRADGPAALKDMLADGFRQNVPALIDVPVGVMPEPWPYFQPPRIRPVR